MRLIKKISAVVTAIACSFAAMGKPNLVAHAEDIMPLDGGGTISTSVYPDFERYNLFFEDGGWVLVFVYENYCVEVDVRQAPEGLDCMWSSDRFSYYFMSDGSFDIEAETKYDCNGYTTFKVDPEWAGYDFVLTPTGKFRENSEIDIFGHYFVLAETDINESPFIGDINRDCEVNMADLVMLHKYLLGQGELERMQYHRADMSRDGKVNATDLSLMKNWLMTGNA